MLRFLAEDPVDGDTGWSRYPYSRNSPVAWRDPLGLYSVDASCRVLECSPAPSPFGDKMTQMKQETDERCTEPSLSQISNPRLRDCMRRSCQRGKIRCDDKKGCGGYGGANYWRRGEVNRTAYICPENLPPLVGVSGLGQLVAHEWAHGCGWERGNPDHDHGADPYQ